MGSCEPGQAGNGAALIGHPFVQRASRRPPAYLFWQDAHGTSKSRRRSRHSASAPRGRVRRRRPPLSAAALRRADRTGARGAGIDQCHHDRSRRACVSVHRGPRRREDVGSPHLRQGPRLRARDPRRRLATSARSARASARETMSMCWRWTAPATAASIRSATCGRTSNVRPSRARFKIYIIDEVHMLTKEAFNALLKTLEEPPEHVKFIFCTTEPEKIPITILSRCQRFDFAGIQTPVRSPSGWSRSPRRKASRRSRRRSRSWPAGRPARCGTASRCWSNCCPSADSEITVADVHAMLGTAADGRLGQIVQHLVQRNAAACLAELDAALLEGVDVGQLLDQLLGYLRDVMAACVGCPPETFLHVSRSEQQACHRGEPATGLGDCAGGDADPRSDAYRGCATARRRARWRSWPWSESAHWRTWSRLRSC